MDSVLFIVDMNNGFAREGALSSERVEKIIPNIVKAIEKFYKCIFGRRDTNRSK